MKKVETNINDNMFELLSKITVNKAEFIRQAIQEKIEQKESKISPQLLSKLEDTESRLHQAEKMIYLLNNKIESQTKLLLKLYEISASTKLFFVEDFIKNVGIDTAKSKMESINNQVENQLQKIREMIE